MREPKRGDEIIMLSMDDKSLCSFKHLFLGDTYTVLNVGNTDTNERISLRLEYKKTLERTVCMQRCGFRNDGILWFNEITFEYVEDHQKHDLSKMNSLCRR